MPIPNPKAAGAILLAVVLGVGIGCVRQPAGGGSSASARQQQAEQAPKEEFGSLTVDQVQALIDKHEASIFDNNSEARYHKSHLPTAKWVAFDDVKPGDLPADKDRPLVFYCANEH